MLKWLLQVILPIFISLWVKSPALAQTRNASFIWGINGHPLTQHDYQSLTWQKQIDFLKDLNVKHYRFDVLLNEKGLPRNELSFNQWLKLSSENGIVSMPVLMFSGNNLSDSGAVYKKAFQEGAQFAKRYGEGLQVLEIGNELELYILKHGDGTSASHYDLTKAKRLMIRLKGLADGIKSVKRSIKISFSLGWTHLYYLELLKQYNVNYDIIGYHWYSDMGFITNVRAPYGNILKKVKEQYEKTIWITEFNTHFGTRKSSFIEQDKYIDKSVQQILKQGIAQAFFIYELFDEPALVKKYPHEAFYGLIYIEKERFKKKPAYLRYKTIIKESFIKEQKKE